MVDDRQRKKIYKSMLGNSVTIGGNGCQRVVVVEVTRDYEEDNLEEQVVRRGQDGDVQVCGGGGAGHRVSGADQV